MKNADTGLYVLADLLFVRLIMALGRLKKNVFNWCMVEIRRRCGLKSLENRKNSLKIVNKSRYLFFVMPDFQCQTKLYLAWLLIWLYVEK